MDRRIDRDVSAFEGENPEISKISAILRVMFTKRTWFIRKTVRLFF